MKYVVFNTVLLHIIALHLKLCWILGSHGGEDVFGYGIVQTQPERWRQCFSETLVSTYESTQCHNTKECHESVLLQLCQELLTVKFVANKAVNA